MIREQMAKFITGKDTKLVEAMQKIDNNSKGILFAVNQQGRLCGAVTDGDIRRWLLKTGELDVEIRSVMNASPHFFTKNDYVSIQKFLCEKSLNAVPIVNKKREIIDIVLRNMGNADKPYDKTNSLSKVPIIIMAGGEGTRLYPYTKILPKPLIPIGEVPIAERVINYFCDYGAEDFLMTVNYRKSLIRSYFCEIEKKYRVNFIEEDKPLGTAGSLRLIKRQFHQPVFVTNCDTLIRADYDEIYKFHQDSENAVTIVTAMKNDTIPYGVIHSKENGEIDRIVEKPKRSYLINTGMYVVNPEMISLIPDNEMFHMTHLIEKAMSRGYKVGMYPVSEDSFLDMGEFAEMKRMEEKLNIVSDE